MHIKPTVGRVLWFYPGGRSDYNSTKQPHSASVAHVNDNGTVNIGWLEHDGQHRSATGVPLVQAGEDLREGPFCMWMPGQQRQAAKTEAAEAKLAGIPETAPGQPLQK